MSHFESSRIRFVEFNVENLFILLDHYRPASDPHPSLISEERWRKLSSSTTPNKPIHQVRQLAAAITDLNPDIVMLCEVGGRESLENFSHYFLNNQYSAHLIEGNSNRGIDLGYLVRRTLPYNFDLLSHKHRHIDFLYPHELQSKETGYKHLGSARRTSHKFSRDVLELRAFANEAQNATQNDAELVTPEFIVLLVHLKSQLDRERIDPNGRDRRRAELEKLVKIYNEINHEFEGRVPVLMTGDFNGVAARGLVAAAAAGISASSVDNSVVAGAAGGDGALSPSGVLTTSVDPEFEALYRDSDLEDCLELAGVFRDERMTYMQFYNKRPPINKQLDYIFVPSSLASRVNSSETWVFRYKDDQGLTLLLPRSLNEKRLLPSDHYPVVLTLDPIFSKVTDG
jgi:endonuclease/exonuclease/phosphatase family metal-dependent hydrolase